MTAFEIRPIPGPTECLAIYADGIRSATIFPPMDEGPHAGEIGIYPWFPSYPDLAFTGLPAPLKPEWDWHPSLAAIRAFLGIEEERVAA